MKNKKIRISLWDKYLRNDFYRILSVVSVVFALFFIPPVEEFVEHAVGETDVWGYFLIGYLMFLVVSYVVLWILANRKKQICLNINQNKLEIREGDIFSEPDNVWKVIGVNEYFDTVVDNRYKLVSPETLHGKYLTQFYQDGVEELDNRIISELENVKKKKNKDRKYGKKNRYPLGTLFCDRKDGGRYILTVSSRTNEDDRAYLSIKDYIDFLLNFWEELDKVYNGYSVSIPLFCSGIVRFQGQGISHQELLEMMIWTLRNSHIKMAYGTKVSILLYGDDIKKVNLYYLKKL